jgi:hypothetical protein
MLRTPLGQKESSMVVLAVNVSHSVNSFLDNIFLWLPRLIGAAAVLVLAWIVATLIARLVQAVSGRAGVDRTLHGGTGGALVARAVPHPSRLLGTIVFWLVFIAGISIAVDVLGIAALQDAVRAVWGYVPNVLAAFLIFLVAGALSAAIAALATRTMGDTMTGRVVRAVAPTLIMAVATFMILDELKIASNIVVITYAALMGGIALAFAVAFGLGGREVAAQMLQSAYSSGQQNMQQMRQDVQQGRERARQETERMRDQVEAEHQRPDRPGTQPTVRKQR